MMKNSLFFPIFLIAALGFWACGEDKTEPQALVPEVGFFDAHGEPVTALQRIDFGKTVEFTVEQANVYYSEIMAPTGWQASFLPELGTFGVTAPPVDHLDAATSGDIVLTAWSRDGSKAEAVLAVAAAEPDVVLTLDSAEDIGLFFGETVTRTISAAENVAAVRADAGEGWHVTYDLEKMQVVVTPPQPSADALRETSITLTPLSSRGTAGEATTFRARVDEGAPVLELAMPEPADLEFAYGRQLDIAISKAEHVFDVETGELGNWNVVTNLGESKLTVTAPDRNSATADDNALTITLTPKGALGTSGTPVTLEVMLTADAPSLNFTETEYPQGWGEVYDYTFTSENLMSLEVESTPEGWSATASVAENKVSVTAPNAYGSGALDGTVVLKLSSESGKTDRKELTVRVKGIATAEEFIAFGEAVAAGSSLDAWMNGNEVLLVRSVDLSASEKNIFVGAFGKPFSGTFNGGKNTVTLGISTTEPSAGLFAETTADARIYDLNLAGKIVSDAATTEYIAAVVCKNGASLENIVNRAEIVHNKLSTSGSYIGSLAAFTTGASVSDCRNEASIKSKGVVNLGGLIGAVAAESQGQVKNCSNTGSVTLDIGDNATAGYYGGLVGNAADARWEYTSLTNGGDLTVTLTSTSSKAFHSLGGIVGSSYGELIGCINRGNIQTNGTEATRRIGGILGSSGSSTGKNNPDYTLTIENCDNYGSVKHCSRYVGGILGVSENGHDTLLKGCTNYGDVTNNNATSSVRYMGGIVSFLKGGADSSGQDCTIENCTNKGKISGLIGYCVGGISGNITPASSGTITIKGCINEGAMDIVHGGQSKRPMVAGLAVLYDGGGKMVVSGCRNTADIKAQIYKGTDKAVSLTYISRPEYMGEGSGTVECDEATKQNSTGKMDVTIIEQ